MTKKKLSPEELKEINKLIAKYNIKEKTKENDFKELEKKPKPKDISEITNDEGPLTSVSKVNIEYNIIKEDFARLESYKELMGSYKLNEEQVTAVADIYNRAKETQSNLGSDSYQHISEKIKEISEISKRIINEVSGNYIKSLDEYRNTP
jgi:DNA-directed RNA polymerase subunit F